MLATVLQLALLFMFILCGFLLGKLKKVPMEKSSLLSMLLANVFLPSKVFLSFSSRCTPEYFKTNFPTLLISLGMLLFLVAFSWFVSKLFTKEPYTRNVYRYSFTISNYAYLGYVLVEAVLGPQALTDMILFCIPFSFYTYSFGFALLNNKGSLWKKTLNPMTIAIFVGLLFGVLEIPVPDFLQNALNAASGCTGPLSMLLTGLVVAAMPWKALIPDVRTWLFSAMRLVVIPAILWGLCYLLRICGLITDAVYPSAVIMGSMSCGLNTIVFPSLVGEDCSMGARYVLVTNILCLATIPMWIALVT
ncbi:MAG: hypothetical protein E7437_02465 [Ruminococcaceae bacterium]|nr:hypothetical protein [Oscillospiraceae bacterium]